MNTTVQASGSHIGATGAGSAAPQEIAYVMNGFPRLSETFIANEIYLLERLGLSLQLFSVKREAEPSVHPVVAKIRAPLTYLPKATSLSNTSLAKWLANNLPRFGRGSLAVLLRHPLRYLRTLAAVVAMCWRYRSPSRGLRMRKVFLKEFLQAAEIAARIERTGGVGHLHGHFCHGVANITWFASRLTGIPFSFTAHAKDIYQGDLNPGDLLERKLAAARFVATCTCANAEVLRQRHPRPDEVHAIYHGLDTKFFAPVPQPRSDASPLILSVGRLVAKKGFDSLVAACALLREDGVKFRCLIVGERGDAYDAVRDAIQANGLTQIVSPTVGGPGSFGRHRLVQALAPRWAWCRGAGDGRRTSRLFAGAASLRTHASPRRHAAGRTNGIETDHRTARTLARGAMAVDRRDRRRTSD